MNSRSGAGAPGMRSNLNNMNSFASQQQQPARQTPRLQNTNKTGLGNGSGSGWGGFGMPVSGGGFGGLGGGAGGGAPGMGQPRPGQLSGFAQVMGGGTQQGPIDLSDFPSLSGGPRPQQQSASNAGRWNGNNNAVQQPPAQPQPPQAQPTPQLPQQHQPASSAGQAQQSFDQFDGQRSQQPSADRTGGGDDFPPLGGQALGDEFAQSNGINGSVGSPDMQQTRMNGQQSQLPIREGSGVFQQNPQASAQQASSQSQPQPSQNGPPPPSEPRVKKWADMTEAERWGMPGLSAIYEHRRQVEAGGEGDLTLPAHLRSSVTMGHDLNSLGMDLDSPEPLHPTFTPFPAVGSTGSTFDFHERHMVPDFNLPAAYTVTNVPSLDGRMNAFADESLFTIFYQQTRDVSQELAANELINREWRWHKILRQWLQKDTREANSNSALPIIDLTNGAPIGSQPIRTSERGEKGVYVFFDAMNWRRERRYLDLDYEHLDSARATALPNGGAGPGMGGARLQIGGGAGDMAGVGQQGGSSQIAGA